MAPSDTQLRPCEHLESGRQHPQAPGDAESHCHGQTLLCRPPVPLSTHGISLTKAGWGADRSVAAQLSLGILSHVTKGGVPAMLSQLCLLLSNLLRPWAPTSHFCLPKRAFLPSFSGMHFLFIRQVPAQQTLECSQFRFY